MANDPTLRLTFDLLRIRVAEMLGIAPVLAGNVAALPTDVHDLDLVGRLVNDGYRRFVSENEKWSFLNVPNYVRFVVQSIYTVTAQTGLTFTVGAIATTFANDHFNGYEFTITGDDGEDAIYTVTDYVGSSGLFTVAVALPSTFTVNSTLKIAGPNNVGGEAYRYYMPGDFYGVMKSSFIYDENGPRVAIDEITEVELREYRAGSRSTGTATLYSFRPINTTNATTGRRWEAMFWPEPTGSYRVSGVYKRFPQALTASTDVSVAGFQHDQTILAAALAAAEIYRNDTIGVHESSYQQALARSMKLDARATPARNRPYGDMSDKGYFRRPGNYAQPTSYGGIPLD